MGAPSWNCRTDPVPARKSNSSGDYASALSTLGGVYAELGQYDLAEEKLLAALDHAPDEGTLLTIHGNLGILYVKMRLTEKAIAAFEQVLTLDPADRQARMILGRLKRS